ncbi:MAG: hypothetical protein RL060_1956, partial [Bacteroidota bacterium]
MKYLLIAFTMLAMASCVEPSKTQETNIPKTESSTKPRLDTTLSTTESLKLTYKERISPANTSNSNAVDSVLIEMISIIPEIKAYSHKIDSTSKGKSKLVYKTLEAPSADSPYYYIKVDEKTTTEQHTKFQFYVNPVN